MKRIVLCADDYGQAEAISQGIISLIEKERLSATSCLVNSPHWSSHAKKLLSFKNQIDVGLHFNLTEGKSLSKRYIETHGDKFMPLSTLLRKAYLNQLDKTAIEAELHTQIDYFTSVTNFLPRFIDGHQHVHQFPIIRDALIKVYDERLRRQGAYVRLANGKIRFADLFKRLIIQSTGMKALKSLLKANDISHNASFAGIYSFSKAAGYQRFFTTFLDEVEDGGLIMCHPGLTSSEGDSIANARFEEYQYISSSKFLEDCQRYRIVIKPFSSIFEQKKN